MQHCLWMELYVSKRREFTSIVTNVLNLLVRIALNEEENWTYRSVLKRKNMYNLKLRTNLNVFNNCEISSDFYSYSENR